ncbi:MAG: CRTAC1 family protein [Xanthomonadales bacterium]|nr:CRTAC1 family protein [Xanthomonadales bacterium]
MNNEGPQRHSDADVPDDDRIIGQAVRWSLIAAFAILLTAAGLWLLFSRAEPVAEIIEDQPIAAATGAGASDPQPPEVRFTNVTQAAGIDFAHVSGAYGERLLPETMGGGVAFLDYDSDGWQDLLFINSGNWSWRNEAGPTPPVLYRNQRDGTFENVTSASGLDGVALYGMGVAVADIDGDGDTDMFLTAVGTNRLLRNEGGETFIDITVGSGLKGGDNTWSTGAAFFDYDRDGDLDLFVCNYVTWSRELDLAVDYRLTGIGRAYGPPTNYAGTHSYLYRNDGNGQFTDVSVEAGVQVSNPATGLPAGKALAVATTDIDGDGWTDLLVANDTVQNFLFHNLGGRFEEAGMGSGFAFDNSGAATGAMGIDVAHFSNGDELAVAVGNFANEMTSFYVARDGQGLFTDEAIVSGVGPSSREALSFGLFFFDYDLDGRLDLLQTNGHVEDEINIVQPGQHYEQPTQLFWNCGPDCMRHYAPVPPASSGELATPVVGRGASYADYDLDGDLDVVITQVNRPPLLLRNDQSLGHHWLRIVVRGAAPNLDALGASVSVTANGVTQRRSVTPNRSYLSQVELPQTFGLGSARRAERIEITWPDGMSMVREDIAADQVLTIGHPNTGSNK